MCCKQLTKQFCWSVNVFMFFYLEKNQRKSTLGWKMGLSNLNKHPTKKDICYLDNIFTCFSLVSGEFTKCYFPPSKSSLSTVIDGNVTFWGGIGVDFRPSCDESGFSRGCWRISQSEPPIYSDLSKINVYSCCCHGQSTERRIRAPVCC